MRIASSGRGMSVHEIKAEYRNPNVASVWIGDLEHIYFATYIPELGKANPDWFGISLVTAGGHGLSPALVAFRHICCSFGRRAPAEVKSMA